MAAAQRGVDVRVLVAGSATDKEVVRQAGRRSYTTLLEGGVRLLEYERTMLHAKIMTVDRSWTTVGSTNMDNRSLAINDELNISVFDTAIVADLDSQFEVDSSDAREIDLRGWQQRPVQARLKELAGGAVRQEL